MNGNHRHKSLGLPAIDHLDIWANAWEKKASGGRGRNGKHSPYGIQKLRELILELAVRGRLAPQDPNDEPASVLLEKIAEEKARLVKEGKIKRQKKLPEITEEEEPFELPEGWEWVYLNDIGDWGAGATPNRRNTKYYGGEIPWFKSGELVEDFISESEEHITDLALKECSLRYNKPGDILIAMYGATIGKTSILSVPGTTNQAVCACTPFTGVFNRYLLSLLKAYKYRFTGMGAGGAQPNISRQKIIATVIALPPEAEQHRIVAKVDELMALCDRLEQEQTDSREAHQTLVETLLRTLVQAPDAEAAQQAWQRIAQHFDLLFTTEAAIDQLKQTILQLAVMGKLVPQDPNDEPASVLLEKISKEKARLVKEGEIRKQKKLPEIAEDEKPFELPNGWLFVRLEDVVDIMSGVTKGRKLSGRKLITVPYLRVANVQRGRVDLEVLKTIDIPEEELEKYKVHQHDLLITEGGDWDKVGRTAIWHDEVPLIVHQNHVFKARRILQEQNVIWIEKYLNSVLAREYFAKSSKQTTNLASINKTQLRGCLVAIPPLAEQHRIVAKTDELMALCDALKARIQESETTQRCLADAVVHQAVGQ